MNPERAALKRQHHDLFSALSKLLFEADPVGINFDFNIDEYEPEVGTILPRLLSASSVEDVHTIVYEEFLRWFNHGTAGPKEAYAEVSSRIWELLRNYEKGACAGNEGAGA